MSGLANGFLKTPQLKSFPSLTSIDTDRRRTLSGRYEAFTENPGLKTLLELLFKIEERGSTLTQEIYSGVLGFVTVACILAINPSLLVLAGYDKHNVTSATALFAGVSCIATGMLSNLPFIMMPVLGTSLYMSKYMSQWGLTVGQGNVAVFFLGIALTICSWRPISVSLSKLIPKSTNVGIYIGVGLLCSLEGLNRVGLVKTNDREGGTLQLGDIWTPQAFITLCCYLVTGTLLQKKFKASIMLGLLLGSVMFWGYMGTWPQKIFSTLTIAYDCDFSEVRAIIPSADNNFVGSPASHWPVIILTIDLLFIVIVLFSGLTVGMSQSAGLTRLDGSTPRSRWLYFACGMGTMLGAFAGSGPILITGESIVGIQAGARSGLSTIVCGILFLVSSLMTSFWSSIPDTGIATVLLIVGFLFFDHTATVDWKNTKQSLPTFTTCIMTAFSCSVLNGAVIGTLMYILLSITTDYAGNMTEKVVKTVFKLWDWLWTCWHGDVDNSTCHDIIDEVGEDTVISTVEEKAEKSLPAIATGSGGHKYYQLS